MTATDALGILGRAVGLPVVLDCPPPCLPGTAGPPGARNIFEIELGFVSPHDGTNVGFTIDAHDLGSFVLSNGYHCRPLGDFGLSEFTEVGEDAVTGVIVPAGATTEFEPVMSCRFQADLAPPRPADFDVRATVYTTEAPIEGLLAVTSVRVPEDEYPHY